MAFSTGGSGKKHTVLSDINITPMVDVMLVLLVIFIMAAPLMTQSVKVKTANSKAASNQAKTPPVVLAVNAQGQYFVYGVTLFYGQAVSAVGIGVFKVCPGAFRSHF